jgi:hypothetical protein
MTEESRAIEICGNRRSEGPWLKGKGEYDNLIKIQAGDERALGMRESRRKSEITPFVFPASIFANVWWHREKS